MFVTRFLLALSLPTLCATLAFAQPQPTPIFSPTVNPDKTITFRLRAPNALKVEAAMDNGKRIPLTKDEKGVWTGTSEVLPPDLYGYTFSVDGVNIPDPINGETKTNALSPNSMVLVPGDPAMPWEQTNIPHGTVHHHFFHSPSVGDNRDAYVYTPPGYQPGKSYPLLVLLHGYSDAADGWTTVGKANLIFDSMIAKGAKPFIAVMPFGYGFSMQDLRTNMVRTSFQKNTTGFEKHLMDEVIPFVEKNYKLSAKREERAIAGLSMGGAETLFVGLRHLDKFAWIGAFSSAPMLFGNPDEAFPALVEKDNARLKLLWIACGKSDGLLKANQTFSEWLKGKKIEHKYVETEGAHTWLVWRRYLSDFMSQVKW